MLKATHLFILQSALSCDNEIFGDRLHSSLDQRKLTSTINRIHSSVDLKDTLFSLSASLPATTDRYILHFDSWCNEDGLALVDAYDSITMLSWKELGLILQEVYQRRQIKMIVAFSRCPCHGVENLLPPFLPCPFEMIIAVSNDVAICSVLTWYQDFYQALAHGRLSVEEHAFYTTLPQNQLRVVSKKQLADISWNAYQQSYLDSVALRERRTLLKREILATKGFLTKKENRQLIYQTSSVVVKKEMKRHLAIFLS